MPRRGSGRVERLDQREVHARREAVSRLAVLAGVADTLDRGGVAEEVAHAGDEDAHAVLGVGGLGARAAGGAEDLLGGQAFARAAKKLHDERLEGAAALEGDLA